jgi:predicted nucleotidyltransferase
MTNVLSQAAERIAGLFDARGIEYALMGGIAVRAYGIPRATYDIDFTAAIKRTELPSLLERAVSLGFMVPEPYLKGWLDQVAGMPLLKLRLSINERGIDIDIFLAESEFQHSLMRRRRWLQINGYEAWLVSPEDLILLKLLANRPRDLADVGDVIFMQGQLDTNYMRRWAGRLDVADRLEMALKRHD